MPFEGAGGGSGAVLSHSRTARPGEKWRQGGGWTPRAGRDTRRPETAGGALISRRHGPWTSIRVCAYVCVTAARVGSESEKRRDKLDGRAQGCTRSAWGADRLGTAIGCDPPDKFEKYRHRGTGVPEPPVSVGSDASDSEPQSSEARAGAALFLCKRWAGVPVAGEGRGEVSGRCDCCWGNGRLPGLLARVHTP